ncbi:hypothetical protein LOD99_13237 [Oopsacas minuta]|uniref:UDP-xylose and UDP-N-acetylglucosamine transporter n=1 Tax=Oopsacas minuta TaxID=111878 RepID=A0AAV7JB86_9METZ|nr:hypothetical protein LOD99_13237 [Oopsacas minuta]
MKVLLLSLSAVICCCVNVVVLEFLLKEDPNMANTMTFCQFLFISTFLFATHSKFGSRPLAVPPVYHALMVTFFFISNVVNNWVFKFNISLPLHMIFRSGSLLVNMILGVLLMNKRYSLMKYLAVVMVTIGIALATTVSAKMVQNKEYGEDTEFTIWLFGIFMLVFALISSSMLGLAQEKFVTKFGKHPQEAMYMSHILPLPGFLIFIPEILTNFSNFSRSTPINLYILFFPKMWLLMILNVASSFLCIRSIFSLTTEAPSLTVNLVVSLRKFVSLIFSVLYFQNPFTIYHWLSTVLVFAGTFIFSMVR